MTLMSAAIYAKVLPISQALADSTAWATALRHDQASTRANTPTVQWNTRYNVVKLAPLVRWTETDIWQYIREHKLPYNELHEQNYPQALAAGLAQNL